MFQMSRHQMCKSLALLVLICTMQVFSEDEWANTIGGMLLRSCMYGFGISGLKSEFDATVKDRLWGLNCKRIGFKGNDNCWWTKEFINRGIQDIEFQCKDNEYISGLYSDFTSDWDRKWRVECCSSPGISFSVCLNTSFINEPRGHLEFDVPPNMALHGFYSYYELSRGDRKWMFSICDIERS